MHIIKLKKEPFGLFKLNWRCSWFLVPLGIGTQLWSWVRSKNHIGVSRWTFSVLYSISLLEEPVPEQLLSTADLSCMFLFLYTSPPDCNAYVPISLPPSPPLLQTAGVCTVLRPPPPSSTMNMWENDHVRLSSVRHRSYIHTHTHTRSCRSNPSSCLFPDIIRSSAGRNSHQYLFSLIFYLKSTLLNFCCFYMFYRNIYIIIVIQKNP